MGFSSVIDLGQLTRDLASDPKHLKLIGKLNAAMRAQSCLSDLRQAATCIDVHNVASVTAENGHELIAVQQALVFTAVSLYARATSSTGQRGERGAIQVVQKLDANLRSDHEEVIRLRNRSFAHVYPGEIHAEGVWNEQLMFALAHTPGPIGMVTRTTQTRLNTLERLGRLIPAALTVVSDRTKKRINDATAELNQTKDIDMRAYERDAGAYFGSNEVAATILGAQAPGAASLLFTLDQVD